jgi:hypothetical protein
MDWSEYGGIWVPCAGSVTPWKSHLGSEEYEPDAKVLADFVKTNATGTNWLEERLVDWVHMYLGIPETATNEEVAKKWFPYNYGYPWEVWIFNLAAYGVLFSRGCSGLCMLQWCQRRMRQHAVRLFGCAHTI